jgi:hypothetical protein
MLTDIYYKTDKDLCMFCATPLKGMSKIACNLSPHCLEPGLCGNFSCLGCYKYAQSTISICPNVKVVCVNNIGCSRSQVLRAPPVVCECTRPVCMNCYNIEEFMEYGICQVCVEKKDHCKAKADGGLAGKRAEAAALDQEEHADEADAGPAAKRSRV